MRLRWLWIPGLLGLAWLVSPITLPPQTDRGEDVIPFRESGHSVLLLLHSEVYDGTASASPSDLEWMNLLTEVFGGCDIRRAEHIGSQPQLLEGRQWIVVPRRTAALLVEDADALATSVERGATVVLEAPVGPWPATLGLQHLETETRSQLVWPVEGSGADLDGLVVPPPELPYAIEHRVERYQPAEAGVRGRAMPMRAPGGRPIVWEVLTEFGSWRVLAIHLADLSRRIRALEATTHLWRDAWTGGVLLAEGGGGPTPSLWPAPYASNGWVVVTGDTLAHDVALQSGSPQPDEVWSATWPEAISADDPRMLRTALGGWELARRAPSLTTQGSQLSKPIDVVLVRGSPPPDATARIASLELRAHLEPPSQPGWPASGPLPYHRLSDRGGAYRHWQLPLLNREAWPRRVELRRWLQQNAKGTHGPLHLSLRAADLAQLPTLWQLAKENRHRVGSPRELLDFWEERQSLHLRWRRTPSGSLAIEVTGPSPRFRHAVALPTHWRDRTLRSWQSTRSRTARRAERFGHQVQLVQVDATPITITAQY